MSALDTAIRNGVFGELQALLDSDDSISKDDLNRAVTEAIIIRCSEALPLLFSRGAQLTKPAFLHAVVSRNPVIFQALLDNGWDINSLDFDQPALRLVTDNEECVRWFLENGADPNLKSPTRISPLATTALRSLTTSKPVMDLLISHGAIVETEALFRAMSPHGQGGLPVMKYLVENGVDVNGSSPSFGTPLQFAVRLGSADMILLLLESGADATIKEPFHVTPADMARRNGRMDLEELILEYALTHPE